MITQNITIAIFEKNEKMTFEGINAMEKCDICFRENGNSQHYKIIKSRYPLKIERDLKWVKILNMVKV